MNFFIIKNISMQNDNSKKKLTNEKDSKSAKKRNLKMKKKKFFIFVFQKIAQKEFFLARGFNGFASLYFY